MIQHARGKHLGDVPMPPISERDEDIDPASLAALLSAAMANARAANAAIAAASTNAHPTTLQSLSSETVASSGYGYPGTMPTSTL
jgi:hypothetical protein